MREKTPSCARPMRRCSSASKFEGLSRRRRLVEEHEPLLARVQATWELLELVRENEVRTGVERGGGVARAAYLVCAGAPGAIRRHRVLEEIINYANLRVSRMNREAGASR